MTDLILTLNAGSSSLKSALYRADADGLDTPVAQLHVKGLGGEATLTVESSAGHETRALGDIMREKSWGPVFDAVRQLSGEHAIKAVSHRIVHGGQTFRDPVVLTPKAITQLEAFIPLAPLHEPFNLAGVAAAQAAFPGAKQVGCFDTAFHRRQPEIAELYALPQALTDEGLIRYGFHGLSYAYIAEQIPHVLAGYAQSRVVVAHLGSGASMCAMKDRVSVATTMGFTALAGLPMGTRCGDVDPGLVLHLIQQKGWTPEAVEDLLNKRSGLFGLSGLSNDMAVLEASDDPAAKRAVAYFVYRCQREIGSLAAALGGLDAIIFTAGIGEHAGSVRRAILDGLDWLGVALGEDGQGSRLTSDSSSVSAWVIPTNEERVLAQSALALG